MNRATTDSRPAGPAAARTVSGCLLALLGLPPVALAERPMTTDRPDRTESPYTVEPGVFQAELDFAAFTRVTEGPIQRDALRLGVMNLKTGLTRWMDVQLVVEPVVRERSQYRLTVPDTDWSSDFGNVTPRAKVNLWGNDGGATSAALMPYLVMSFESGVQATAGVLLPVGVSLPGGFGAAAMAGLEGDHERTLVLSATMGRTLLGPLAGFVEIWGARGTVDGGEWNRTLDVGLTYDVTPNFRIDGGVYEGLDRNVEERTLFLGASVRR